MKYAGHFKTQSMIDALKELVWVGTYEGECCREFGITFLGHNWYWELRHKH